ncbi:hypothetical protein HZA86_00960 [Candidatus Uhrbacteria bacterium]|nr:hypothetical protein [Candidatus Uhrbacteria bacterium]
MVQDTFDDLGLSPNEGKIYEFLIERGESSVSAIAIATKINRRNAYDATARLIDKGLCFEIFSQTKTLYNAVDPDKLMEMIAEKQEKLQKILPALKQKFRARLAREEAYIYRGIEGQKNIFRDMLRVGGDCYFIGAKGGWFDPRLDASRDAFFREAKRKKLKFIQLFDSEVRERLPNFVEHFPADLQYRFLPKEYSTNSGIGIYGEYVVTYTGLHVKKIDENIVFFVIHSQELADSYRKWFWSMWKQAPSK